MASNPFAEARSTLHTTGGPVGYVRLNSLPEQGFAGLDRLPVTVRILLENVLRHVGNGVVRESELLTLAGWKPDGATTQEVPFYPARVLLQDFTGVPAAVDLAAM